MDDPTNIILLFAFIGLLLALLGLPLKHEKVPPNWFYGFRTPKTLSDRRIWYAVNRVAGIDMIRVGVVITASSLVLLALRNRLQPEASIAVLIAIMLIAVGWMAYHGYSILREM